jgi:hypothetical protein
VRSVLWSVEGEVYVNCAIYGLHNHSFIFLTLQLRLKRLKKIQREYDRSIGYVVGNLPILQGGRFIDRVHQGLGFASVVRGVHTYSIVV